MPTSSYSRAEADRLVVRVVAEVSEAPTASAESVLTGPPWNSTSGLPVTSVQSGRTSRDGYVGRAVQDHAERAVLVEVEHQHDGALEVRVEQGRGGDQQVADAQASSPGRSGIAWQRRGPTRLLASAAVRTALATAVCTSAWKTLGMM